MRTIQRTADRALLRDAAAIAAAMVAVGASFGAIAISYGLPTWAPFLLSTVVFAGGAQFLAVGLIAAGNPLAAVFAGLLLNARHLPFGLAVGSTVGSRLPARMVGSHLMTDEVVAFTLAEPDPTRRRRVYWLIGVTLFTSWNLGSALGVLLGGAVGNTDALGLDAAFPAGLIALIMPSLRDRRTRVAALSGAGVAVLLTPVLPAGLPVLCALVGLLTLVKPPRARPAAEPGETNLTGRPSPVEEAGKPVEKPVRQAGKPAGKPVGKPVEQAGKPVEQAGKPVEQAGKPVEKPVRQAGKQETAAESC
jgi:4-azaleucine resistance transporter AzlC